MLGLDISSEYYNSIIAPLIKNHFPQIKNSHAAALIGWGSDVLTNDDELSRDHDWGPRCIVFLPNSLSNIADDLYKVLNAEIPPFFMNHPTRFIGNEELRARHPSRNGSGEVLISITTCDRYFAENLGMVIPRDDMQWLSLSESKLLELTSGKVFCDGVGELTAVRDFYRAYYPLSVWKYRLAYAWQSLGWDIDLIGLCEARGDLLSSRNCLSATLLRIMKLTFLLNRRYSPSYSKWLGKEFYKLPCLSDEIGPVLESSYLDSDVKSILGKLEAVCHLLIGYQNGCDELPEIDKKPSVLARGFWSVDLAHVADRIRETISGPLGDIPLGGAIDQWVTNQDILLDSDKLKLLSVVYQQRR